VIYRLGGMPIGCIVTENRLVEKAILADPANLESKPQVQMQAGQVRHYIYIYI